MKKTIYTIGRDPSTDICLYDGGNLVSRFHAILKIRQDGSYVIIDQSTNGTFINGVRITRGREVPVTRKDTVMFANVAELDWSLVPESRKWVRPVLISVSAAIVLAAGVCAAVFMPSRRSSPGGNGGGNYGTSVSVPQRDSLDSMDQDNIIRISPRAIKEKRLEEKRQRDLEQAKQDSIRNSLKSAPVPSDAPVHENKDSVAAEKGRITADTLTVTGSPSSEQEIKDTVPVQKDNIDAIY